MVVVVKAEAANDDDNRHRSYDIYHCAVKVLVVAIAQCAITEFKILVITIIICICLGDCHTIH